MNFLTKKTFWVMLFVLTLGTVLRLIFLDKPEGLWNDEYLSWYIASIPLGKTFFREVFAQCHMPFYYLYLKFFIHFFGNSDLMLRLTSLLAGLLSILGMYFVGEELKDKKLGILCASLASISSFLIYFSQEVRLYQVLFLFSAMSLLFTLKLIKKPKLSNFFLYLLSNFFILFTHTIGFIFVFFNMIFVSYFILKSDKGVDKSYKKGIIIGWASILTVLLICSPFLFKIFTNHSFSQWWGHFTFSKIGFLITDYFSPIIINITNAPDNFFFNFGWDFVIFELLPALIAIVGIVKALKTKKPEILGLFFVSLATLLILVIASISGKLVFITKYSIEIYPILLALMGYGLLKIENKIWRQFLIFSFCFLNLFYIISNPNSAPKMHRSEGHKIVANLLKNADLKSGDYILLNYYPQNRFEKYFDFKKYSVLSMNKGNFADYISNKPYQEIFKNGKTLYQLIFLSPDNKYFKDKLTSELFNNLKHNQKVTIIILDTVALYSPVQIQNLAENEKEYKKIPLLFLVFSYLKNQTLKECLKELQITKIEERGSWYAVTFKKK